MASEDWKTGVHAIGLGLMCNLVQWYAWEFRARARQNYTEQNAKDYSALQDTMDYVIKRQLHLKGRTESK